jgi:Ni/Co efflux regulator RcnB
MFRKILIAVVASLALLTPLALPAQSDAHGPRNHRSAHRHVYRSHYRVHYRTCNTGPWIVSGSYDCRADALRAAANMHVYQTYVR